MSKDITREVYIIRPATTTRKPIKITVAQRLTDEDGVAMATAVISGTIPLYYEKPAFLRDLARGLNRAARTMERLNRNVKRK